MLRRLVRKIVPVPVRVALLQWPSMLALLKLPRLAVDDTSRDHVVTTRSTPLRRHGVFPPEGSPLPQHQRGEPGSLHGGLHSQAALPFRCELVERDHRFEHRDGAVFRHNRLYRRWHFDDGSSREEWLADHDARVAYPLPPA